MTTLTTSDSATIAPSPPLHALALQIRQPGLPVRYVDLPMGKCTVGSSGRCHVCLSDSSVRPLHCLIVHEPNETIVTRWASGALLNGKDFSSSVFRPGDRLTLGEFEIQLEATSAVDDVPSSDAPPTGPSHSLPTSIPAGALTTTSPPTPTSAAPRHNPAKPAVKSDTASLPYRASQPDTDQQIQRYQAATASARRRSRGLVASLRTAKSDAAELGTRVSELNQMLRSAQSGREQIVTELDRTKSQIAQQQQHHHSELARLQSELEIAQEQLLSEQATGRESHDLCEHLQCELIAQEQQRELFLQERSEEGARLAELEQTLATREEQIAALDTKLQQARETLQESQDSGMEQAESCEQLKSELTGFREEHDQLDTLRIEMREDNRKLEEELLERDLRLEEMSDTLQLALQTSLDLESSVGERESAYKELHTELEALRAEREQYLEIQNTEEQRCAALERSLQQRDEELDSLREALQESRQTLQGLEKQLVEQVEHREQLEAQLSEVSSRCEQMQSDTPQHEQLLEAKQQELAGRDCKIAELNGFVEQLEGRVRELNTTFDQRSNVCDSLETEKVELLSRCEQLADELQSEQRLREEIETSVADRQQHCELLEIDVQSARAELEQSEQRVVLLQQRQHTAEEEAARLHEELAAKQAELEAKQSELNSAGDGDSRRIAEQERLTNDLETARQELETLRSELQELHDTCSKIEAGASETREQLVTLQAEKSSLEESYQQTVQELQSVRDCLTNTEEALRDQMAKPTGDTAEAEPTIVAQPIAATNEEPVDATIETPQEDSTLAPGGATEEPAAPQQHSFIDQYSHLFEDEHGPADAGDTDLAPRAPTLDLPTDPVPAAEPQSASLAFASHSDDVALESYMANLMQRVRGQTVSEEVSAPLAERAELNDSQAPAPVEVESPNVVDTVTARIAHVGEVADEERPTAVFDLSELKQLSSKQEAPTDLSAMRDLANSSARQAIASHSQRRYTEVALGKLFVSVFSLGAGVYLLWIAEGFSNTAFAGGCIASFAALYWGLQVLGLLLRKIRDASPEQKPSAEISADVAPLPIDGEVDAQATSDCSVETSSVG